MSGVVNGTAIMLYLNGLPIFSGTNNEESLKAEVREVTSKFSGGDAEFLYGKRSVTGSAEGLFAAFPKNRLLYSQDFGNAIWGKSAVSNVALGIIGQNGKYLANTVTWTTGSVIAQAIPNVNFTIGDFVTVSIYAKGTGAYYITLLDDSASIDSAVITLTGSYVKTTLTFQVTDVNLQFAIFRDSGSAITLDQPQLEFGSATTGYEPSAFDFSDLFNAIKNRTILDGLTGSYEVDSQTYSGDALITDLKRNADVEGNVTYSLSYQITGPLDETDI